MNHQVEREAGQPERAAAGRLQQGLGKPGTLGKPWGNQVSWNWGNLGNWWANQVLTS